MVAAAERPASGAAAGVTEPEPDVALAATDSALNALTLLKLLLKLLPGKTNRLPRPNGRVCDSLARQRAPEIM